MKYRLWMNTISGAARTNQITKTEPLAKTAKDQKPQTTLAKRSILDVVTQLELTQQRRQSRKKIANGLNH